MFRSLSLTIMFLLLFSFKPAAQTHLGIFAGPTVGNFFGDAPKSAKYSSKTGFIAGISADFYVKEDVAISVMPAFLSTGSRLQFLDSLKENYLDSVTFHFSAISLPVMLKVISNNERFQFSGGLELLLPTNIEAEAGQELVDLKDDIKNVGMSMLFGIGYRIPIGKSHLTFDLTYAQGLLNLANNLEESESYIPRIKSTSWRLTVAWNKLMGKDN